MNYSTYESMTIKAIRWFSNWKKSKEAKVNGYASRTDEFRKVTMYESGGDAEGLTDLTLGIEYCDADGSDYREVMVTVDRKGNCQLHSFNKSK